MKQSNEPFWWSLFAAGGMLAALLMPVLIFVIGIARPPHYDAAQALAAQPVTKLVLLALIPLSLFHWAHRFRFQLIDIGVKGARKFSAVVCYGLATMGVVLTVIVLWRI
jgi:fumarate reductase subunit D